MPDSHPSTASAAPLPDLVGRQLGDYRVLRRLGRGGMAEVYLAEQLSLKRPVAVKVLKSHLAADENYVRRFHTEARAAASLVHANIVQIFEVGRIEEVHFIAQEYVAGVNLREYLARNGTVKGPLALSIMRQVAAALHKAAQQGIVHRDIKPDNIMLSTGGEVKVADFGLARMAGGANLDLTQIGVTMGTPLYMSPEQAEGRSIDPRSDLYSFGVTCFHMLAGRPPFQGETAIAVAVQHVKSSPPRLERFREDLPAGMCRIVHRLMEKEPAQRYASASELLADLRAIELEGAENWEEELAPWNEAELAALTTKVAATQQLQAVLSATRQVRLPRKRRLGRWLPAAAIVFALMLGGGLAWLGRPPSPLRVAPGELPPVPVLDDAGSQYYYATRMATVEAYRAVWEYHPPQRSETNRRYTRLAQQQLAALYLARDELAEAERLFDVLATEREDAQMRAFGLAGQAILLARRGETQQAVERAVLATSIGEPLRFAEMRAEINSILPPAQRLPDDVGP